MLFQLALTAGSATLAEVDALLTAALHHRVFAELLGRAKFLLTEVFEDGFLFKLFH
jgi:hypothetical protein